jgi:hypothetical protein
VPRHYPKPIPVFTDVQTANFWSKVLIKGLSECWPWRAGNFNTGYGCVSINGDAFGSHRVAFFLATGIDPIGLCVLHRCDNRPCCNPAHLFSGTLEDNNADMKAKGRAASGDRHGSRLHPESRSRGDDHPARRMPERLARGDRNGARLHPEKLARGDRNGSRLHPEKLTRGTDHWKSVLTEDMVRSIRQHRLNGATTKAIAESLGIKKCTIHDVLTRTWKHIK